MVASPPLLPWFLDVFGAETIRFGPEEHFRELTLTALADDDEEVRLYGQAPGWITGEAFLTIVN